MARSLVGSGRNAKTYPFIRAYCKRMGSYPYYTHAELQAAQLTDAPADAYASKRGPDSAQGPDDWYRVTAMDKEGRERMERDAGYSAEGLCVEFDEEPAQ